LELAAIFATAFVLGFSGAMMPGPLLTVTVAESVKRGFAAGPLVVLGHAVLELSLVVALAGGLSVIITGAAVSRTIAVLGGLFLIYLGCGMAGDALKGKVSLEAVRSAGGGRAPAVDGAAGAAAGERRMHPVAAGVLTSVSNPYWTLWWATIGLGYITMSLRSGYAGLASFFTGHILADLVWYSAVAAAVTGGKRVLGDRVYRGIVTACGIFLVGLGGYFLYFGLFT